MRRGGTFASIDIGTTKICTIVGEVTKEDMRILGGGIAPAAGLQPGLVEHEHVDDVLKDERKHQRERKFCHSH